MAILFLVLGSFALNDSSYFIYFKDGHVLEVTQTPKVEGKMCYFTLKDGTKSMVLSNLIDFEKTQTYNQEWKKSHEVAEEPTDQQSPEKEIEKKEGPPKIQLRGARDLESYKAKKPSNESDVYQAGTEEASDILGKPRVQEWTSQDDVYLAKETMSRTRTGYKIDCLLKVNQPAGVTNAKLKLTVNLENGQMIQLENPSVPADIPYEGQGLVSFFIETEFLITGTSYSVSAELP